MSVTPEMLAVALGRTAPEYGSITEQQWNLWVSDAEMLIEARRDRLGFVGPIDEAKIDYVVREAVVQHIKKPDDATRVTIAVDDGSSSREYQSGRGRVVISDEWWNLLGLVDSKRAYMINTAPTLSKHLPWCALSFGALYCSCGVNLAGEPIFEAGV